MVCTLHSARISSSQFCNMLECTVPTSQSSIRLSHRHPSHLLHAVCKCGDHTSTKGLHPRVPHRASDVFSQLLDRLAHRPFIFLTAIFEAKQAISPNVYLSLYSTLRILQPQPPPPTSRSWFYAKNIWPKGDSKLGYPHPILSPLSTQLTVHSPDAPLATS